MSLRRFYAHVYGNNFPNTAVSLFSWFISSRIYLLFPPRAINLAPPFVTVSTLTHNSASNAVAVSSPAMPNARTSLCTQSVHSFSLPPGPLLTAPSRFPNTIRFGNRLLLIRMSAPPAPPSLQKKKSSRTQHCLNPLAPGYLDGTVVRGHPMIWSLALCPDGVQYGVWSSQVFLAKSPTTTSVQ